MEWGDWSAASTLSNSCPQLSHSETEATSTTTRVVGVRATTPLDEGFFAAQELSVVQKMEYWSDWSSLAVGSASAAGLLAGSDGDGGWRAAPPLPSTSSPAFFAMGDAVWYMTTTGVWTPAMVRELWSSTLSVGDCCCCWHQAALPPHGPPAPAH